MRYLYLRLSPAGKATEFEQRQSERGSGITHSSFDFVDLVCSWFGYFGHFIISIVISPLIIDLSILK